MLRFENVVLEQGDFRLTADFTLEAGTQAALIGPSGAGKSTLLSAIAGFLEPSKGVIRWQRESLSGVPPGDRPMSILFQDNNLFPHLTVAQNVGLGLRPDLRLSKAETAQVTETLARVRLAEKADEKPASLSGGQNARVAIARLMLRAKPLLLLDEPFAALGPALKSEMLELVSTLAAETDATLVMVSHDPDDARRIANETVLVAEGVAHPPKPTETLLAHPPAVLAAYLGH
ncbi:MULTISPECIES: ATP-binding cassette domain-containing protein [Halocynthiibacter]|uniref:ATP-binding cassette domain-containing protein n=1 Tax=Halocynthiibacter halioticoli TaxID=2986804 RepID=A0AAE3IVW8_9RHOB|nr:MULTISPECIES: ATP-binding cassette domain-containing protein [Halocynthiibacter]MCV6823147.1 ATP-binding cassette domain-containing protein [Halocynthiibacter halioticoli]MCW4056148.1 ATP-binding cassette domain-containing protein [Halocynthiibacter sp. SDUM655004]